MRTITTARAALFIVGNLFAIPLYAQSHDHPVVTAVANADAHPPRRSRRSP